MPTISVRRPHALGLAKARDLERTGASGSVAVTRDDFRVHIDLALLLSPLRSRIEREIVKFCDEHFAPAAGPGRGRPADPPRRRRGD